jgi:hypothetical protein
MLTACSGSSIRDDLGLGRSSPDEFAVVDRPPLSLPPDFDLRPPEPGAPRPQGTSTTQSASNIVFGSDSKTMPETDVSDGSDAEKSVLASAGAPNAMPDIRSVVDREAAEKVVSSRHLIDALLFWKKDPDLALTVNAPAEAARIKEAKDKGEPLNKGATPVIEKQKSGWLGL